MQDIYVCVCGTFVDYIVSDAPTGSVSYTGEHVATVARSEQMCFVAVCRDHGPRSSVICSTAIVT